LRKYHVFVTLSAEGSIPKDDHSPFPFSADTAGFFLNKVFQVFPDKHLFLLIKGGRTGEPTPFVRLPSYLFTAFLLSFSFITNFY
jgi:hypothetical protein